MSNEEQGLTGLEVLVHEIRGLRQDIRVLTGAAMSREQASDFLGLGMRTFDKLVANGRVRPVDNSINPDEGRRGRVTFRREELERYQRDSQHSSM